MPCESNTDCWGNFKAVDVIVAIGSGFGLVLRAASWAALNSNNAGVAKPLTMPFGSITHKLPCASNVTPCGDPNTGLLFTRCGGAALVPPANWLGTYSSTFVPFAIHSPLLLTAGAVVAAGAVTVVPLFPLPQADRPLTSSAANIAVVLLEGPKYSTERIKVISVCRLNRRVVVNERVIGRVMRRALA